VQVRKDLATVAVISPEMQMAVDAWDRDSEGRFQVRTNFEVDEAQAWEEMCHIC